MGKKLFVCFLLFFIYIYITGSSKTFISKYALDLPGFFFLGPGTLGLKETGGLIYADIC